MEAAGLGADQQVRRGLPGQALLRRLRVRRQVENLAIDRAKEIFGAEHANVQPHSGAPGQHGRLLRAAGAGRHVPGHGPRPRRPPDPRHEAQLLGPALQGRPYGVRQDDERIDFDQVARPGARAQAQADRRRRQGLPADIDFAASARSPTRSGALFMVDMAHIAGLVAAGQHPQPGAVRRLRHHDDAQDPRAGRAAADPVQARSWPRRSTARSSPGIQGGPLMHVIAAKAVALRRSAQPEFKAYARRRSIANAKALAEELMPAGFRLVSRRHRQPPDAGRPRGHAAHRQDRRGGARPRRHHRQQEQDPVRRPAAQVTRRASASAPPPSPPAA